MCPIVGERADQWKRKFDGEQNTSPMHTFWRQ
jgi:hypothetical protein